MLKRQRPSSPLPIAAAYGDDLLPSISGSSTFTSIPSIHSDPSFGISRKRPRLSPDSIPGTTSAGGSAGRHAYNHTPSTLSKRRRSPDPMDEDSDDDEYDSEHSSGPHVPTTHLDYERPGESSEPFTISRPTVILKRRRTTAPVLEGSSRGWGPDPIGTRPDMNGPTSYPYSSFNSANPPPGWVPESQIGEYIQENARLYDLHTLRPRPPHPEEPAQDQNPVAIMDVDMEGKAVKERYEEHNKLLGSLFLERQRRLAGT